MGVVNQHQPIKKFNHCKATRVRVRDPRGSQANSAAFKIISMYPPQLVLLLYISYIISTDRFPIYIRYTTCDVYYIFVMRQMGEMIGYCGG